MKVLLMYKDRDLLSQVAQEDEVRPLLNLTGDRVLRVPGRLPVQPPAFVADLELETVLAAMARGDAFLQEVSRRVVLTSLVDTDAIRYRQDILRDCLKNAAVVREIYRVPIDSIEYQQRHWMGIFTTHPSGILASAVEMLDMFVEMLRRLRRIADEHAAQFESEGFRRFFTMIQHEMDDEYFALVKDHLKALRFRRGVLVSAELGPANEGTGYVLHRPSQGDGSWIQRLLARKAESYSYTLAPRDDAGARALGELRDRGLNLVANAAGQSADHIDNFLKVLRVELAFYIGCLNLHERLAELGEPVAIPEPGLSSERCHSFTGLYDVALALTMHSKVVGNDLRADRKDLIVVTGANRGGKSTFLRSVGLAQLMMQCGMFVGAETFSANVCQGLFTHYKREEDASMKSGKFDEELTRMSAIVDQLKPDSLVLFNESFAATNEREGSEIAGQIVKALLERGVKVFYVTHLYAFARHLFDQRAGSSTFLVAERLPDGTRSFRLTEGEPSETSFAADLYGRIFG